MRILILILIASLAIPATPATVAYPRMSSAEWQATTGFLPNSLTDVTTADSYVTKLVLVNITGGAVTVTIKDRSTNCSAGACQIWPVVSIAANTVYTVDMGGVYAPSGVQWTASAATSVVGWIRGTYPRS